MKRLQIRTEHNRFEILEREDTIIEAAPVFRFMIGWREGKVIDYCNRQRWRIHILEEVPE